MNIKRIILLSVLLWIIGTVARMLTCGWLFNWVYQIPPIIWKTSAEITQTGNMISSYVAGFIISVIFVTVFAWLYKGLPEKGVKKGIIYGFIVWLVGALSGMATLPFYMTISTTVVVYWIAHAFVMNIIYGAIVGAIYKK